MMSGRHRIKSKSTCQNHWHISIANLYNLEFCSHKDHYKSEMQIKKHKQWIELW